MEYRAIAKNVKVSPRKVRLVSDSIRDLTVAKAITQLVVSPKRAALPIKKTIESAMANAVNNNNAKKDDLVIKTINITEGITYKRYHFAGRGRTRPYTKRTSHINIILEDKAVQQAPVLAKSESKTEDKTIGKGGSKK